MAACSTSTKPILRKTGPAGSRVPSLAALRSRNSTGSIDSFSHSSSMTDSTANAAGGEPGARYAVAFWVLTTTSKPSMWALAISYAIKMVRHPANTGDPGNAPASYTNRHSAAVSLPSLVAPSFTRMWVAAVGPVPSNTSALVMVSFTGCPDLRDKTAATDSKYPTSPFPPNPPPISRGTTLTLDAFNPKSLAVRSLRPKCPWVLHQIVTLLSESQSAVAECGSI